MAPVLGSGCIRSPPSDGDTPAEGVSVRIVSQADQPAVPIEYDIEMKTSIATMEQPARLGVTITNPTDTAVVIGEERAVQFHHVASTEETLYLYPAGDQPGQAPVEAGCWRLTDAVAVPEYYGRIAIDAGAAVQADAYVYGHPGLPEGTCLPDGDHRLRTTGVLGDDEAAFADESELTDFEWGFTLRIG